MASASVSLTLARSIADNISRLDSLVIGVRDYLPYVTDELAQIAKLRAADPQRHAIRSLLFALASPQNRFDSNVIAARRLHAGLSTFEGEGTEDIYQALTAGKLGTVTSGAVARNLRLSLPYIRSLTASDVNADSLRYARKVGNLFGVGYKVSAMAAHLNNEWDNCFTLDTHMLRQIIRATLNIEGTWTIDGPAYAIVEAALLRWSADTFAGVSPFAVQWSMWAVERGQFDSHFAIYTD